ncbi:hypothetical protein BVY03_04465 [bacterium K02(2017)]|nr:hypothetical protein BVY03_04465 [bacterium K02(2017)]
MNTNLESSGLDNYGLFKGLSKQQQDQIWKFCERKEIAVGEIIIKQGTNGKNLYLIESGSFDVLDQQNNEEFILSKVGAGANVGIMAMIESGQYTATLKATEPSVVYVLPFEAIEAEYGQIKDAPYAIIIRNQLIQATEVLHNVNDATVSSLKNELAQTKKRLSFGRFVSFLIGSVTLYAFLLRLTLGSLQGKVDSTWISVTILAACLAIYIPMMKLSGFPWATYGLTLKNWKPSLWQSLKWTFVFLLLVTGLKMICLQIIPSWKNEPLFSMYGFVRYPTLSKAISLMLVYALFAPVQEFIARGAMQSSLQEFLAGKRATFWAIILSTLMFAQIHLHMTPAYALAAFFPSLFWGALYAKQRSLLGVSVSHIIIGIYVAFFLGAPLMTHS